MNKSKVHESLRDFELLRPVTRARPMLDPRHRSLLGREEFLYLRRTGFSEHLKRIRLEHIQAVTVEVTRARLGTRFVLGLTAAATLGAFYPLRSSLVATALLALAFFVLLLALASNERRGATCRTQVVTAYQKLHIEEFSRLEGARDFIRTLTAAVRRVHPEGAGEGFTVPPGS